MTAVRGHRPAVDPVEPADAPPRLAGRLLVAPPSADGDPSFGRSVVLVLGHDDGGALGLVLNRPGPVPVEAVLPHWAALAPDPGRVFVGGPVAPGGAVLLGWPHATTPVGALRPVAAALPGGVGLVDVDGDVEPSALAGVRVFAGHAGWSAGQLDEEVARGAWVVADPVEGDVSAAAPEVLWEAVLRRQPGFLPALVDAPPHPRLN